MAAKKKSSRKKTAAKKVVSKKKASPRKKSASKKTAKKAARKKAPTTKKSKESKEGEKSKAAELEVVVESAAEAAGGARAEPEVQVEPVKKDPEPSYDVPEKIDVNEFRERSLSSLLDAAAEFPLKVNSAAGKGALIFELLAFYSKDGNELEEEGGLKQAKPNYTAFRPRIRRFSIAPDAF